MEAGDVEVLSADCFKKFKFNGEHEDKVIA